MNNLLRSPAIAITLFGIASPAISAQTVPSQPGVSPFVVAQANSGEFEFEDFEFWADQCINLTEERNYAEALTACEQAISLEPRENNVDIWFARGRSLFYLGQYTASLTSYAQVVEAAPNHSLAIASQCASLFYLNRYEDAIDTCEQALQLDGNWGNRSPAFAWYYRGLAFKQLGRLDTALSSFERATTIDSAYLPALAERCETLTELSTSASFDELKEICNPQASVTAQNNSPNTPEPAVGSLAIEQCGALPGDRPEPVINSGLQATVLCYERALANDPQDITLWIQQGLALEQLGFYERAATVFGQAVELNPSHAIALVHHCGVLNQMQNYEVALELCDRAFQTDSGLTTWNSAYGWNQRSVALLGLGRYEEALAAANQAIEIEQRYAPAWNSRALSMWWLGQGEALTAIEQAIDRYEQAKALLESETFERTYLDSPIVIYRGYILALYNKGRILSSSGNYEGADSAYQQALTEYCQQALTETKYCQQALTEQTEGERQGMNVLSNIALADIWVNRATALLHFDSDQSLEATRSALIHNRTSFPAWYNQGLAYFERGNNYCAFEAFSQANRLNPNDLRVLTGQGMALAELGRAEEAIALFDQVLSIDPNFTLAQRHRESALMRLWAASSLQADKEKETRCNE